MYAPEEQATGTPATLADRLKNDPNGTLRDSIVQALHSAEDEIHASLSGSLSADDAALLKGLLEAVSTGERELLSAWESFHAATGPVAGAARR
jgi:hypothetical protein